MVATNDTTKAGQDVESMEREPVLTAGGNVDQFSSHGNQQGDSSET